MAGLRTEAGRGRRRSGSTRRGSGAVLWRGLVKLAGQEVLLTRKDIRRAYLRVRSAEGPVEVNAPAQMSLAALSTFVASRADWIDQRRRDLARAAQNGVTPSRSHVQPDGTVLLWGRVVSAEQVLVSAGLSQRVVHAALSEVLEAQSESLPGKLQAQGAGQALPAPTPTPAPTSAPMPAQTPALVRAVTQALRQEVRRAAEPLFDLWERRMGVAHAGLRVHDTFSRWGSCNVRTRWINLSLSLAHFPPTCLELIVVHELTHLLEASHNARFYAFMDAYLPDWRERDALLKRLSQGR